MSTRVATDDTLKDLVIAAESIAKAIDPTITARRYGYRRAKSNSNPSDRITYMYDAVGMTPAHMDFTNDVFIWGDWQEFVEQIARPVMLKADGTVDYELDHNDQTKKLDGTASDITDTTYDGGAMVEFGRAFRWVKRWEDTEYEYVVFANKQIDDSYKAYAHTGSDGEVKEAFYWGMFTGLNVSSKLKSIGSGAPMVSQTREVEITYAKAIGAGWHTIYNSGWNYINDLLTLIGKSDNTQAVFGEGRSLSSNTSKIDNGTLKDKGCFWGDNGGVNGVKVLWIENHWGNIWQGMAGIVLDGANGIKVKNSKPYCDTPVSAADWTGYTATGIVPSGTSGSYVNTEKMDENGYIPKTTSGSATTYMCDGLWFDNGQLNYPVVGGRWSYGASCGSRCVSLLDAPSSASGGVGSRPSYIP